MSQVLLIGLGLYLAACYAYGMLLVVRLLKTRTIIRPTSRQEPHELARAARIELSKDGTLPDERRVAA